MNTEKAKFILQAYRPDGQDAQDPTFQEALEQARQDPELARWLADESRLDASIAEKLTEIRAPANLTDSILAGQSVSPTPAWWRRSDLWALAAAMVVLLTIVGIMFPASGEAEFGEFRDDMGQFLSHELKQLDLYSDEMLAISRFLDRNDATDNLVIPHGLHGLPSLGCRVLEWQQHKVSLICFSEESGKPIHLFVVDRQAFPELPETPEFAQAGPWMTAGWAQGDKAYLIAGTSPIHDRL